MPRWFLAAGAIALFVAGLTLSRCLEHGIRVETVRLGGDTPALQFLPANSGLHPIALLGHGVCCSKETLFRYGEALAAAGFTCFAIDFPGHGESPRRFSLGGNADTLAEVARALGTVDVYIGHSMGAFAGGDAVREGRLKPKLFIAVGANPTLGDHAPPLLLLAGRFEEFFPPAMLKTRTDARLVLSPWSDHALELYDPLLVDAAVKAARTTVGMPAPPAAPTAWHWRLAGFVISMIGMIALAKLCLTPSYYESRPQSAWMRGPLVAAVVVGAIALAARYWLDAMPHLRRVPVQITVATVAWLAITSAGRVGIPRWSFAALFVAAWIGSLMARAGDITLLTSFFVLVFLPGTVLGGITARYGPRRDGDVAMAIVVGYTFGQVMPKFL